MIRKTHVSLNRACVLQELKPDNDGIPLILGFGIDGTTVSSTKSIQGGYFFCVNGCMDPVDIYPYVASDSKIDIKRIGRAISRELDVLAAPRPVRDILGDGKTTRFCVVRLGPLLGDHKGVCVLFVTR